MQKTEQENERYIALHRKEVMGFSKELEQLYHSWIPKRRISNETYRLIYKEIDKGINE